MTSRSTDPAAVDLVALEAWARDQGAPAAFLQVDLANDPVRRLDERAGFVEHHTYECLAGPTDPVSP